ncbi:hypothetical protein AAFF_G00262050 [Aldrovandia affinis]|uniref:Prospero domain-containing protein n=1 Tax=Aldrovandia affinis TaxID=143900 RepID=A0AAD7STN8_9TELE|nr:hypothetical protein AAFF_G00262050 [Aldrovandia affinis]
MNPSLFDHGMHTSSESNLEKDKAELQQTGKQRNLYGDSLTSYRNRSIISQIPQKNIQHKWAVRDDFSCLPAAAVSSYTIADPCQEDQSSTHPKGSMAEALSPTSRLSIIASHETNHPLNEYHRAKRVRVENIIQNMSESPNIRFPGVGERSDAGTRDNREMLRGTKRKWRLPQSGGGCGGKEDCGKLREQLWAMQRLLGEIEQRLLQVYWPSSSEAENREEGTARTLEWDDRKSVREPPEGSECKLHVHQDSEAERRLGRVKMDGWQVPQVDGIHLTFNQGHKNLPEALKCELTRAAMSSLCNMVSLHFCILVGVNVLNKEGLTPNHLKKAKLIFFYCRYPNSNVLKTFFPDIKFNRCITSQLIKWFSNFREFYYIQMEKSARQSIMDGVNDMKDLSVTRNSELFRALNVHFDKANDFQVPGRFLEVAEITLREFFNAILVGKDFDPSWKKAIYKVICKLDSEVPEVFKSTVYL